jgi:predicted RNase H-like nuclease
MIVGIDGCVAGWLVVALMANQTWSVGVYPNMESVWAAYRTAQVILIDIPIGLSENGDRLCDQEARRMLRPKRAVSVFPVPCRPAVYAKTYQEACEINQAHTGRRLSKQTWGIVRKIREVDDFLRRTSDARGIVREVHPEVCFCTLNMRAMVHGKKKAEGSRERIAVLEQHYPGIRELIADAQERLVRPRSASLDDVLDAAAAAITGLGHPDSLATIPGQPPFDDHGLPMEMVYRKVNEKQPSRPESVPPCSEERFDNNQ